MLDTRYLILDSGCFDTKNHTVSAVKTNQHEDCIPTKIKREYKPRPSHAFCTYSSRIKYPEPRI